MQHFNATKKNRYIELFSGKPELVIDFPEWLLSDQMLVMIFLQGLLARISHEPERCRNKAFQLEEVVFYIEG